MSLKVAIDRDRFLSSFSAVDETGEPVDVSQWDLGPSGAVRQPDTDLQGSQCTSETMNAADSDNRDNGPLDDQLDETAGISQEDQESSSHPATSLTARQRAFAAHATCYEFLAKAIPAVPSQYPGPIPSEFGSSTRIWMLLTLLCRRCA